MLSSLALALAFTVAAPAVKDPPKKEAPSIVGEWEGVEASFDGNVPRKNKNSFIMKFTADNKVSHREGEEQSGVGSYKVDFSKSPAEIDLTPPADVEKGIILGIVKIEGDKLLLCHSSPGDARPVKFESPVDSKIYLLTLKRIKK